MKYKYGVIESPSKLRSKIWKKNTYMERNGVLLIIRCGSLHKLEVGKIII